MSDDMINLAESTPFSYPGNDTKWRRQDGWALSQKPHRNTPSWAKPPEYGVRPRSLLWNSEWQRRKSPGSRDVAQNVLSDENLSKFISRLNDQWSIQGQIDIIWYEYHVRRRLLFILYIGTLAAWFPLYWWMLYCIYTQTCTEVCFGWFIPPPSHLPRTGLVCLQ